MLQEQTMGLRVPPGGNASEKRPRKQDRAQWCETAVQMGNDRNWDTERDLYPGGSRDNIAAACELDQNVRMGSLCKDEEEKKKKLFIRYVWVINYIQRTSH